LYGYVTKDKSELGPENGGISRVLMAVYEVVVLSRGPKNLTLGRLGSNDLLLNKQGIALTGQSLCISLHIQKLDGF